MKEATGEFSMTVVTIVAIVAIAAVIGFLMPSLRNFVNDTWTEAANGVVEQGDDF